MTRDLNRHGPYDLGQNHFDRPNSARDLMFLCRKNRDRYPARARKYGMNCYCCQRNRTVLVGMMKNRRLDDWKKNWTIRRVGRD